MRDLPARLVTACFPTPDVLLGSQHTVCRSPSRSVAVLRTSLVPRRRPVKRLLIASLEWPRPHAIQVLLTNSESFEILIHASSCATAARCGRANYGKAVVGLAQIKREAYPGATAPGEDWSVVVAPLAALNAPSRARSWHWRSPPFEIERSWSLFQLQDTDLDPCSRGAATRLAPALSRIHSPMQAPLGTWCFTAGRLRR